MVLVRRGGRHRLTRPTGPAGVRAVRIPAGAGMTGWGGRRPADAGVAVMAGSPGPASRLGAEIPAGAGMTV